MAKTHPLDDGFAQTASLGADGALDKMLEETVGPRMTTPPPRSPLREISPAQQAQIEDRNRARNTHLLRPAQPGVPKLLPNANDVPAAQLRRYRRRVRAQGGEIA